MRLCREGRIFGDESLSRERPSALSGRPMASVPKLAESLAEGRAARSARASCAVPAIVADLKRSVVQVRNSTGSGSGFAIDPHGTILTNRHVVDDSSSCTAHFANGTIAPGLVLYRSPRSDLAVIGVAMPTADFLCLSERRGDEVAVGERVVALGFPQDAGFNVTEGIVGALGVRVASPDQSQHDWVRTSALINGGNSGGPLVDLFGDIVGMATWGQVSDGNGTPVTGMNYCIPHAVICRELREFRRLVSEGEILLPSPEAIIRQAPQPDSWDELNLAINLICARFRMRVIKKVPTPERSQGFSCVELASEVGDHLRIFVDSFVYDNGPPYVTMYCSVGELPDPLLGDPKALANLLQMNLRLPHWNLALEEPNTLLLRFSRELQLMDAAEILNAVEDLSLILKSFAKPD